MRGGLKYLDMLFCVLRLRRQFLAVEIISLPVFFFDSPFYVEEVFSRSSKFPGLAPAIVSGS